MKNKLLLQKEALVVYLKSKVDAEDWHAVSDAANDIRVIEAKLESFNNMEIRNGALQQDAPTNKYLRAGKEVYKDEYETYPDGVKENE